MPYKWNKKEVPPPEYPDKPLTPEDNKYFLQTDDWNEANKQIEKFYTPNGTTDLINQNTKKIDQVYLPTIPSISTTNTISANNTSIPTSGAVYEAIPVKSVTNWNGLALNNGNLSMSKQWVTSSEVTTQINSSVPQATTTTAGKVRIATTLEAQAGTDNTIAITPLLLKQLRESGFLGGIKKIYRVFWNLEYKNGFIETSSSIYGYPYDTTQNIIIYPKFFNLERFNPDKMFFNTNSITATSRVRIDLQTIAGQVFSTLYSFDYDKIIVRIPESSEMTNWFSMRPNNRALLELTEYY